MKCAVSLSISCSGVEDVKVYGTIRNNSTFIAHELVNTFGVDRWYAIKFCLSAKQRPYPMITIRGEFFDDMVYTEKHIRIISSVTVMATIFPVIGSSDE